MKRFISVLLTGLIALQPLTVLATESNSSDVLLSTTPQTFSAIVPTELPVYMDKLGVITTAEDTIITNTSKGPIIVHDIAVQVKDSNWSMAHFTSDFTKFKVNSNIIGLQFNGDNVTSSGTTELNPAHWAAINGLESMALNYNAKLTAQSGLLTDVRPVKVVFTLKWHEAGKADIVDPDSGNPLKVGDNKILTFNFTNIVAEDNSVVWSSSDESVATVKDHVAKTRAMFNGSKSCEVTAIGVGNTTITGTLKDGTSASMDIVVAEKIVDIDVGAKYTDGNYEYSYGQGANYSGEWVTASGQKGWGVKVIDKTQNDYAAPLTMIQGRPVTNMTYLFYASPATTLNLINWDTSNVTSMQGMFGSSQATSINGLNNFNTSNVTDMDYMFNHSKATSLDLNLNTSNVTDMNYMFYYSQATSLDLSSFDTSNVTNMEMMFSESQATNLDLSSFDTSNVTTMYGMFNYSQATSLDLSSFDTSNVTTMYGMFNYSQATSLDLSSFDTSNVTDMQSMFNSSQATSLDLSSFDTSKVTNMSMMFANSQATSLDLSSFDTSNVTNMGHMFQYSQATSIAGLNKFKTPNVTTMRMMFFNTQATSLDLSFNTSNVIDMYNMFGGSQVTSLDLRSFNTSNVKFMNSMFSDSQATNVTLTSFNTANVTDMNRMFINSKMTNLDLSSFNTAKVTDMGAMFNSSKVKNLIARTQADANKYKVSSYFSNSVTITVKA